MGKYTILELRPQLFVQVHRRLLHDDARGVGEALNETAYDKGLVVRGVHTLLVGPAEGSNGKSLAAQERELALEKRLSPWVLLASAETVTFDQWAAGHTTEVFDNIQLVCCEEFSVSYQNNH